MQGNIKVNGKKMTVTELVEAYLKAEEEITQWKAMFNDVCKDNAELTRELQVKEDLLTIKGEISKEPTEECSARPSIEWYEDRHQSDCIKINQLHVTIDVLVDKLSRLREIKDI